MEKHRTAVSLLLVAVGASLLLYGLFARAAVISSSEPSEVAEAVVATPEPAVAQQQQQEVAKDDVKPVESGQTKKASEKVEKAPAACPT